MSSSAKAEACLRAGWIYHQKSTFGKTWQQKWATIAADGTLVVCNKRNGKRRRKTQTYDLRRDCMYVWTGAKCQHLLPPSDLDSSNLIELLLTGDRRLAFCGLSPEDAELWCTCIESARSETELPGTLRKTNSTLTLGNVPEEDSVGGCCICSRPSSKVKAIDYRPSTKHSTTSSIRKARRVSFNRQITMIDE